MHMFKWTPKICCSMESPIISDWILLPFLTFHYMNCIHALFSIVVVVGKPLRVDHATASLNQPSVARILVECDIAKTLLK